jgi:hypothetical protein
MMQKVKMPFSPGFGKKTVKIGKAIGSSSPPFGTKLFNFPSGDLLGLQFLST